MAEEEHKGGNPAQDALLLIGFILLLAVVWVARGATMADVRGIFIHSPTQGGGAYGPAPGTVASTTPGYTY
jgi:hypothetical protein